MKKLVVCILLFLGMQIVNAEYVSKNTLKYHDAYNAKNPYTKAGYYGQCTWYVWGRMLEKKGISIPTALGNAGSWFQNIHASYKSNQIAENSIMVIGNGSYSKYGHVVFIEEIKGDDVYITEGNYNGKGNLTGYRETIRKKSSLKVGNSYYNHLSSPILGFIIPPNQKKYKPEGTPVNLGEEFTAMITPKYETSYAISSTEKRNGGKVTLQKKEKKNYGQLWKFKRKKDGSYVITNLYTNLNLDILEPGKKNGDTIQVWNDSNGEKNNWFIYEYNGAYRITPKSGKEDLLAIDIPNNEIYGNQKLQLYEALNNKNNAQTFLIEKQIPSVSYTTHVENKGWMNSTSNGRTSGTTGQSLRLEAYKMELENIKEEGNIEYLSYVQNQGWESTWKKNGEVSGTTGKSLRTEAIRIRLTGEVKEKYDIYYRVHIENGGWLDWARNGEITGSNGLDLRIEAIEIKLIEKREKPNLKTTRKYITENNILSYESHIENIGWMSPVSKKEVSGTIGQNLRLEAVNIHIITPHLLNGNILYRSHIENIGWESTWKKNGEISGTTGKSLRLEAIQIKLTENLAKKYNIVYRVYIEKKGWSLWVRNGTMAGTTGQSLRIEAIEINLERKDNRK